MVLQKRYTRTNFNTLELKMTVTDPKYYRTPWTAETKRGPEPPARGNP
jgi:hypothetical protein